MLRKLLSFSVLILFSTLTYASDTVFVGKGAKMDTFARGNVFDIYISGMTPKTVNDSFGLESINVKITSQDNSYISIYLNDPSGNSYLLYANESTGRNFDSTFFSDTGLTAIHQGKPPYRGVYRSQSFLREINNGQNINGHWTLVVYDGNMVRKDVCKGWSLRFGTHPMADYVLDSSNLPIIIVNTHNVGVPSLTATMHIIDNGTGKYNHVKDSIHNTLNCEIGLHGNYSRYFPKLSYNIQTLDKSGNKFDTAIVGWPAQHEWAFIANFSDRSLLRNAITQHMYSSMGQAYSPRWRHAEIILDGKYMGVFLMIEKIKRGKNFVNITKLDTSLSAPTTGDSLTGGYMIKTDWKGSVGWYSNYVIPYNAGYYQYFRYYDPVIPNAAQQKYIQSFYDSFENAIYGSKINSVPGNWRNYMDEKSVDDYFFIQEITMNLDGYRASFYMWKNKNSIDRHIHLGPVWDFDWTMYDNYWLPNFYGWLYTAGYQASMWWFKLLGPTGQGYGKGDAAFKNELKCKWTVYRRNGLNSTSLDHFIDSNVVVLQDAQVRNFKEWPELGMTSGVLNVAEPRLAKTWIQEVDTLKGWIHRRLKWLDKYVPGTCNRDIDPPTVKLNGFDTVYLEVNTAYRDSGITYHDNYGDTNVTVVRGSNLDSSTLGTYQLTWFLSDKAGNRSSIQRVVIVIDTIKPTITFIKGDTVDAEVLLPYLDTDTHIADNYDVSPKVSTSGNFNFTNNIPTQLGYFTRKYLAVDQSNNKDSAIKYIHVIDSIAPKLQLLGLDTIKVEVYNAYHDSDFKVSDNFDTASSVKIVSPFKNNYPDTLGIFPIYYVAKDQSLNKDSLTRFLWVVDTIAPQLHLRFKDSVSVKVDSMYTDSGYWVSDNYDKHPKVDTSGNFINTLNAGVFQRIYAAHDQSGNRSNVVLRVITVEQGSGIDGMSNLDAKVSIFPNPSSGLFNVKIKLNKNGFGEFKVFNEFGQELSYLNHEIINEWNGNLNMSKESQGVYTLKIQSGTSVAIYKLILIK